MDNHVGRLFLSDFEQSAIHLPESIREDVVQLNYHILQVYYLSCRIYMRLYISIRMFDISFALNAGGPKIYGRYR